MSRLLTAAATHTGYLRTTNQDLALATNDLAAVADGMGGHLGGEVAARIAVEQLLAAYRRNRTTEGLIAAVRGANEAVYQRGRSDRNLRGMGTTLTAVAVVGDLGDRKLKLALVNVGDSRGYLLDRATGAVHKLTEDHSVVEEMVRNGELTSDEAAVHPHKHILTRALGVEAEVEPDCWELDLEPGSRLLLCSDGLTNELDEDEIAQVMLEKADLEAAASELVRAALQRGGTDNVTVVVIDALAGDAPAASDEVVVLPEVVGGNLETAAAGESAAVTGAVPTVPPAGVVSSAAALPPPGPPAQGAGAASQAEPATTVSEAAPRSAHTRPMVLVPQKKRERHRGDRIMTIRVALFVLVFVAVLGGAAGLVVWFDKASFYVGLDRGYVAIFQGRPGGLLWFKPSVVERTTLTPADLLASNVAYLEQGMEESSYQAARNLVRDLSLERTVVVPDAVTTTTTTLGVSTTTSTSVVRAQVVTTTVAPTTSSTSPATTTTVPLTTTVPVAATTTSVPSTSTTGAK